MTVSLQNLDSFVDGTGATLDELYDIGGAVVAPLKAYADRYKKRYEAEYSAARAKGETQQPVTLVNLVNHLEESRPQQHTAKLLRTVQDVAEDMGILRRTEDGFEAMPIPINEAEEFRKAINANTDYNPPNIRQAAIMKQQVDDVLDNSGGALYKKARSTYAEYKREFKNRQIIDNLLSTKRGTEDRKVGYEHVLRKTIFGKFDNAR